MEGRKWPEGYAVYLRGEVAFMQESFRGLGLGFGFAVVLIYFVMVPLFRSFLSPVIVMLALPLGLAGVLWVLFLTATTFNLPSFMGTIFIIGIANSNSVFLVEFPDHLPAGGRNRHERVNR